MPDSILSGSAGKHWLEAGRMILAHRLASGPDPFDTVRENVFGKTEQKRMGEIGAGIYESGPILAARWP